MHTHAQTVFIQARAIALSYLGLNNFVNMCVQKLCATDFQVWLQVKLSFCENYQVE